MTNKPNELTPSPSQAQPTTTTSTTPSKQKGLLFGANRQSNKPRNLIVEPEIFDYRDFSRGKKGKRAATTSTKADIESSESTPKQSSTTKSAAAAETSTSPKQKNEVDKDEALEMIMVYSIWFK